MLITSKTCRPYDSWRIKSLGSNFTQEIPFKTFSFSSYSARKVNGRKSKRKRRKIDFV